jgi:hypothetical protein
MKVRSPSSLLAALLLLGCFAQAQAQNRSVTAVPPRPAPATITPATPGPGVPNPAGLPSTMPYPAGIPSLPNATTPAPNTTASTAGTPATTTTPVTAAPYTPPLDGTVLMPSSAIGSTGTAVNNYTANPTATMGAGGGPNAPQTVSSGAGPYTALQLAESFLRADANRDGELTRAEFQRLTIAPVSFDEMDRDHNGVVTRSEYDDATR